MKIPHHMIVHPRIRGFSLAYYDEPYRKKAHDRPGVRVRVSYNVRHSDGTGVTCTRDYYPSAGLIKHFIMPLAWGYFFMPFHLWQGKARIAIRRSCPTPQFKL